MAAHFDKIIKENFRDSLVGLMNHVVGINFILKKKVALRLQLEMLANLHKLQKLTIKILERMPIVYDLKKDLRYQQGKSEGHEEGLEEGLEQGLEKGLEKGADIQATVTVINMLLKTDFPVSQIADLAGVKVDFVKDWEKKLKKIKLKSLWNSFGKIEKNNKAKLAERSKSIATAMLIIKDISLNVIAKVVELPLKQIEEMEKERDKKDKAKGNS